MKIKSDRVERKYRDLVIVIANLGSDEVDDAGHSERLGRVDALDLGVRLRRQHVARMETTRRHWHIVHIERLA